ncbi:unnamed protein product [Nezara viridula]|uniref:Uncharacterized protein n=1 Tax=Nezara viridula TaxID=85310 RepID=A0A9P0E759_NEZVI|nr:unnamed protein product [Nezara viridula]
MISLCSRLVENEDNLKARIFFNCKSSKISKSEEEKKER